MLAIGWRGMGGGGMVAAAGRDLRPPVCPGEDWAELPDGVPAPAPDVVGWFAGGGGRRAEVGAGVPWIYLVDLLIPLCAKRFGLAELQLKLKPVYQLPLHLTDLDCRRRRPQSTSTSR